MERLTGVAELLDGPLDDRAALEGNLRDLRRANRWLGGASGSIRAIEALLPRPGANGEALARPRTILDVGTGGADLPLAMLEHAARTGRSWRVTGLDSRPEVLAAAAVADRRVTGTAGLDLHVGDGRSLPFPDGAFDVVHASLVVHHLDPTDAAGLIAEMVRVARLGIVVNDLVRGRLAYVGAWLLAHLLTTNRLTRHDAPLSVRRAYTRTELERLLEDAGQRIVTSVRGPFGHRWAIAAARRP
ncbi:MAG TPA: methyltransferase domain-containing protein [Candidatus Saccharimonadales bacterium]|nr:methyltransferase domain-containing protein [Candidatus Saccharimonadales bacterium]